MTIRLRMKSEMPKIIYQPGIDYYITPNKGNMKKLFRVFEKVEDITDSDTLHCYLTNLKFSGVSTHRLNESHEGLNAHLNKCPVLIVAKIDIPRFSNVSLHSIVKTDENVNLNTCKISAYKVINNDIENDQFKSIQEKKANTIRQKTNHK